MEQKVYLEVEEDGEEIQNLREVFKRFKEVEFWLNAPHSYSPPIMDWSDTQHDNISNRMWIQSVKGEAIQFEHEGYEQECRRLLKEVSEILAPHQKEIMDKLEQAWRCTIANKGKEGYPIILIP